MNRRISTIRADARFLIRYIISLIITCFSFSLLLEINLEYILNFILFDLIISVYLLELFSYVRFLIRYGMARGKLILSHYYTLFSIARDKSRINSLNLILFSFVRNNFILIFQRFVSKRFIISTRSN